jgi:hypothetical protein
MKSTKNPTWKRDSSLRYYRIVPAFEYCLIIDDISSTPTQKVIERLKDTL